jgi:Holliday junction resolvase RusA-like endonuclease
VGDVDGPVKALLDSLNGLAWDDDSQIEVLHVFRHDDKANPRVEVEVA